MGTLTPGSGPGAVLFAQMVNDPGGERDWTATKTKVQAAKERKELFDIIRDLTVFPGAELIFSSGLNVIIGKNCSGRSHILKNRLFGDGCKLK